MRSTWHVGAAAALALLAACGPSDPGVSIPRASPTADPTAARGTSEAGAGVHGEVVAVSDVEGDPERPVRDGFVLAIPRAEAESVWAAADRGTPEDRELPYWNPSLPPAAVGDAGGTVTTIDGDGRFGLDVPPGEYLLCLATGADPLHLGGCAPASLTGDDRLRVTSGEGGVELQILE